ncbi:hypothetical protein M0R45_009666 [Rubus argutus]|uniref:HMA domain-containing protein n=1 Tax=Rubus argutus TaxID=59490 RepID=A0AAW1Y5D1_RUBAR
MWRVPTGLWLLLFEDGEGHGWRFMVNGKVEDAEVMDGDAVGEVMVVIGFSWLYCWLFGLVEVNWRWVCVQRRLVWVVCRIDIVSVDGEKGTVTVVGDVDPVLVVRRLRKAGKVAEICQLVGVKYTPYEGGACHIL